MNVYVGKPVSEFQPTLRLPRITCPGNSGVKVEHFLLSILIFMSSTAASTSNFHLILHALDDYAKQTGIDLTKNPFAEILQNCDSSDSILQLLQNSAEAFKDYRDGNRKLINWLSPVVEVLHAFSGILSEVASLVRPREVSPYYLIWLLRLPQVPFQPGTLIFVGIDALLTVSSLPCFLQCYPCGYPATSGCDWDHCKL